jgi:hypothetical protein
MISDTTISIRLFVEALNCGDERHSAHNLYFVPLLASAGPFKTVARYLTNARPLESAKYRAILHEKRNKSLNFDLKLFVGSAGVGLPLAAPNKRPQPLGRRVAQ